MDDLITRWINAGAGNNPVLDACMIALTRYGVPLMILLVVLQWWSREDRKHRRHVCVVAGLSFLLALGINQFILLFVHRARPYTAGITHLIVPPSIDWSFPSDHAAASFAVAAAFLLRGTRARGILLLIGAIGVALSRTYVGTHYVTDTLGGAITGAFGALIVSIAYREGTRLDRRLTSVL